MTKNKYQKLIMEIMRTRAILFNPNLSRALGSISAGLFLGQLLFWWKKGKNPKMIYKTVKELEDEIVLSKHQQLSAQKICVKKGVLKVIYKGVPPRRNFILNIDEIIELMTDFNRESKFLDSKCPNTEHSKVKSPPT